MAETLEHPDSFVDPDEPRSSKVVWDALCEAKTEFGQYNSYCDRIDRIIDATGDLARGQATYFSDQEFDLFWSSLEILKVAVYSHPPAPVVSPRFADRDKVATTASEVLERCLVSSFERGDFDQVMLGIRDDLIIAARGVPRVTYETDEKGGGKRICKEHVDRLDFLHEPARKWSEVGWVAFAGYLTEREFNKRFAKWAKKNDGKQQPQFNIRRDRTDGQRVDTAAKCKVWEVWHLADNRVYWVSEGVDTFLDESEPFLKLEGFYPCPRPAYGTIKRRSLIPVPDYVRYERTLEQINELTRRIHSLLAWVRVKGLIPAGGEAGAAVESALSQTDDDVLLIPIPAAGLTQGTGQFVQFLPLQEFAATITGLIEARRELIQNFYELSGISDIMRGATEAEETLGAQQLKSQFGSVRVREKIDELQRVARDVASISAEIIAEKFDQDTILSMAQMSLPTRADVEKKVKEIKSKTEKALNDLESQAAEMIAAAQARGEQVDPQQAQAQFDQQQQAIIEQSTEALKEASEQVTIDDVMKLFRDQKARAFAIDIETDSTIMTDELGEKQARAEFMDAFSKASAAVMPLLQAGKAGAKLAGGMLKFATAPFRAGRQLDALIDDFVEAAPQMAAAMNADEGAEGQKELIEAQNKLAEAEMVKAQAQTVKVQSDAARDAAERERKMIDMQAKFATESEKLRQQADANSVKFEEMIAKVDLIKAQTIKALSDAGVAVDNQALDEFKSLKEIEFKERDQAIQTAGMVADADRAERQQGFSERQGERSEARADRQQDFAERSGDRQQALAERAQSASERQATESADA